jgi:signal transduction histidine kinase
LVNPWGRLVITLHRSSTVRIALLFLGLFACVILAAFWATSALVRFEIERQLRLEIIAGSDVIASRLAGEPAEAVFSVRRTAALFNADGSLILGEPGFSSFVGWRKVPADNIQLEEPPDDRSEFVLTYGRRVGDKILVVGTGMDALEDSDEALLSGLLSSLTFVTLTGFTAVAVIAWRLNRRLGRTEEALHAWGAGEFSRRLPIAGSGDEFDRVAIAMNGAIERIASFVESTRQVTTDAAHDLTTPMRRLHRRLAEVERGSTEEVKTVARAAASDAEHIINTFNILLRNAKAGSEARRARFGMVSLLEVLESVADAFRLEAEQAGQYLQIRVGAKHHVIGDRELLVQAFANLIENAIRYAGQGAIICLRTMTHGAAVEAAVSDTGPGMPEAERERALRAFDAGAGSGPRAGLGFATVKAITDLHEARLVLSDNRPGLRVTISFAQSAPPAS